MRRTIFTLYLLAVAKLVVFKYPCERLLEIAADWRSAQIPEGFRSANLTLFHTIRMYIRYRDRLNSFENLAGNIVIFIPFGFLLPWTDELYASFFRVLAGVFVFSAGIEVFQLFTAFGAFDVDDILLNCLGGMAGYLLFFVRAHGRADRRHE